MEINGAKVKELREKLNISRVAISAALGFKSDMPIRRIEANEGGTVSVHPIIASAIARRLKVKLDDIRAAQVSK